MLETGRKLEEVTRELMELAVKSECSTEKFMNLDVDDLKREQAALKMVQLAVQATLELMTEIETINEKLDVIVARQKGSEV